MAVTMAKNSTVEAEVSGSCVEPGHRRWRPRSSVRLVLASVVLCCSCISAAQRAQRVLLTKDPGAVQDCRFIARVESSDDYRTAAAYEQLRDDAVRHGAGAVLMVGPPSGADHGHVIGEAYLCGSAWVFPGPPGQMQGSFVSAAQHSPSPPPGRYGLPGLD